MHARICYSYICMAGVDKALLDELFSEEDNANWAAVLKALKRLGGEARPEGRMLAIATVALLADTVIGLAIPR